MIERGTFMKYVAKLGYIDNGFYVVVDAHLEDLKFIFPGNKYVPVSHKEAIKIKEALKNGNQVKIPRELIDEDKKFDFTSFVFSRPDHLQAKKTKEIMRINNFITAFSATTSALDLFNFFTTSMVLLENGFFVTEKNKDELYLELADSGDEMLIETLKDYLESKKTLMSLATRYKELKDYRKKVMKAKDEGELNEAISDAPPYLPK